MPRRQMSFPIIFVLELGYYFLPENKKSAIVMTIKKLLYWKQFMTGTRSFRSVWSCRLNGDLTESPKHVFDHVMNVSILVTINPVSGLCSACACVPGGQSCPLDPCLPRVCPVYNTYRLFFTRMFKLVNSVILYWCWQIFLKISEAFSCMIKDIGGELRTTKLGEDTTGLWFQIISMHQMILSVN